MKITATQYAKSLYELTDGKSEQEVDGVVASFLKVLIKNRHLKIAKKVMAKFTEISNQEQGLVEAEVTTREKIHTEVLTQVRTYIKNKYKAREVVIKNKIDLNIKGGIVIKVGDEILDGSIAGQLNGLRKALTK
ncbi:MAG: ATP synthase F1 subunit delta [Parcubacteria group bacterium]|jgi:F-type H+-transporting ATPase subunit delta